jgi:fatty acid desaturase
MDYIKNNICENIPYTSIKKHYTKIKYIAYFFYFTGIFTLNILPIFPAIMLSFGIFGKEFILRYYILHREIEQNNIKSYYMFIIEWIDWFFIEESENNNNLLMLYILISIMIYEKYMMIAYFNIILADIFKSIHFFIVLYKPKKYINDITKRKLYGINVVNYTNGNDFIDYIYGWLNYKIEQHLFPNLSMLEYRKLQPYVKSYCQKNNIEYVQIKVF